MTLRCSLGVISALVVLSGCMVAGSKQVATGSAALDASTKVIHSVEALSARPIKLGTSMRLNIDVSSEVLVEGGDRRFAVLLTLPQDPSALSIRVSSFQHGTMDDPAILYPELRTLNSRFEVVSSFPHKVFAYRTGLNENSLDAVVFINDRSLDERFLLILNRPVQEADQFEAQANLTNHATVAVPAAGGVAMWMIPTGINLPPKKMLASPTGRLELLAEEYRVRKVK